MTGLARLAVTFADVCVLDIEDRDHRHRVAAAASDPVVEKGVAETWAAREDPENAPVLGTVFRTGHPVLCSNVVSGVLETTVQAESERDLVRRMGLTSYVAAPLVVRGKVMGVFLLMSAGSSRRYDREDLALVEELARRASCALDNARLYRDAKEATVSRDQVLGTVAHDLRSPLNAITLGATRLQQSIVSDDVSRRLVESIVRSAKRMARLIDDLLDVTQIEARTFAVELQRQAASELVTEAIETLAPMVSNVKFEALTSPELPEVLADRGRVLQVFSNLVGNSIEIHSRGWQHQGGCRTRRKRSSLLGLGHGPGDVRRRGRAYLRPVLES